MQTAGHYCCLDNNPNVPSSFFDGGKNANETHRAVSNRFSDGVGVGRGRWADRLWPDDRLLAGR